MHSGRPVLLLPRAGLSEFPSKVLVAWDGSLPATRAIQVGLPFLDQAETAVVLTVGQEDPGTPNAEAVSAYLKRRGIAAKPVQTGRPERSLAETLLNQAEAHDCGLIVMGGYSHARLYESLLGGVTHDILNQADRPILLAH